jgi:23S rRNA (guanosine2251-2'-O)-methyltransferase
MKVLVAKNAKGAPVERITDLCRVSKIPYTMVEMKILDAMTDGENHQGVVASMSPVELISFEEAVELMPEPPHPAMAVIMDHVEDPRNMGAMIRSAEAAGAVFAAIPLRRGALPTGTVAKTSAGASLRLPLASVGNIGNVVRKAEEAGFWTIGLDAEARTAIYDSPLPVRCIFVVGGEGAGLSRTTAKACDELLSIPMMGGTGSLNASVALSVCMFEWLRIHRKSNIRSGEDERTREKK